MKIGMIIPTYNRDELLRLGLYSLSQQTIFKDIIILVINDGQPGQVEKICDSYKVNYIETGMIDRWTPPCISINMGAKQIECDILILSCPEMWYIQPNCLELLIKPVIENYLAMGQPLGRNDNSKYLQYIKQFKIHNEQIYSRLPILRTQLPFTLAFNKKVFDDIGGYDERFIKGYAFDDDDFIERMKHAGCHHVQTKAQVCHLYHSKGQWPSKYRNNKAGHELNRALFEKGQKERG